MDIAGILITISAFISGVLIALGGVYHGVGGAIGVMALLFVVPILIISIFDRTNLLVLLGVREAR